MTRIFIVRHGQSEWNAAGRWQGLGDPPLPDRGREEAKLAASKLDSFEGSMCASPLRRALETAQIIAAALGGRPVFIVNDLHEIDVGEFSGLTNDEIERALPDSWAKLRAGELDTFPGGESRANFLSRLLDAISDLATRHPDIELLAVSHGGAVAALERMLGVHPGVGVGNLVGRWFEWDGTLAAGSDRIDLLGDQES